MNQSNVNNASASTEKTINYTRNLSLHTFGVGILLSGIIVSAPGMNAKNALCASQATTLNNLKDVTISTGLFNFLAEGTTCRGSLPTGQSVTWKYDAPSNTLVIK